nr:MAG TPA: hypothetical protein [Caudoviricetes sp.]
MYNRRELFLYSMRITTEQVEVVKRMFIILVVWSMF